MKVGIVGGGKMGTSLFNCFLQYDLDLVWISRQGIEKKKLRLDNKLNRLFRNGIISQEEFDKKRNNIHLSENFTRLVDCDLIIESVPEQIEVKKEVFKAIDTYVNSHAILASNSSSILPQKLSPSKERLCCIVGLHFFYPVEINTLIEVIIHENVSQEANAILHSFINSINKEAFIQIPTNAFLLNRLLMDIQAESYIYLLDNKLSMETFDQIAAENFFGIGLFEIINEVGTDTVEASVSNYISDFQHAKSCHQFLTFLRTMVNNRILGKKNNTHVYHYFDEQNRFSPDIKKTDLNAVQGFLKNLYICSAKKYVNEGQCAAIDLNEYLKSYLQTENGPFDFEDTEL